MIRKVTLLLAVLVLGACASAPDPASEAVAKPDAQSKPREWAPPEPNPKGFDWVKLTSGEWLKGEITVFRNNSLEFDSDKLDDLTLDWDDVAEVRSPHPYAVLYAKDSADKGTRVIGTILVKDGKVRVGGKTPREFPRSDLLAIVPGTESEWDHWSGKLSFGFTGRSGNTNQLDLSTYLLVRRRTVGNRFELTYNAAYSEVEGTETADNQHLTAKYDVFLGRHWYITPANLDFYRDPFQNVKLRFTPSASVGYHAFDRSDLLWDIEAGAGGRRTEYDSVLPGEDEADVTAALLGGTSFEWEVTDDIDFTFNYTIQVGVPDTLDTNQHAYTALSIDLIGDFDLDLSFTWDRVGDPQPDSDGNLPLKNDYRFTVGIGWEF